MRALRPVLPLMLATALAAVAFAAPAPPAVEANADSRAVVVNFARAQIGKPYKYGTTGMATYDCTGLVYRTFMATGFGDLIGNRYRSAANTYSWFAKQGLITTSPKPGDLVAWGNPASHIGIYTGMSGGHPMTVSALTSGVKEHRVHSVTTRFRAYLRVPFESSGGGATGSTTPSTTTSLPAPFKSTVNLAKGSHTFYRMSSAGNVLEQRTITRSTALKVAVDPSLKTFSGHPHAQIKAGSWAGWWRRAPEAGPTCCRTAFSNARTLRLTSGDHLFKTFHDARGVVIRRHVRVTQTTSLKVSARATFGSKIHFQIADGPMAGTWVAKSASSQLVP